MTITCLAAAAAALASAAVVLGTQTPGAGEDAHRRLYSLGDFRLESGVVLPNAKLSYATFGTLDAPRDGRHEAEKAGADGVNGMRRLPLQRVVYP